MGLWVSPVTETPQPLWENSVLSLSCQKERQLLLEVKCCYGQSPSGSCANCALQAV